MTRTLTIIDRGPDYHPKGYCSRYAVKKNDDCPFTDPEPTMETTTWTPIILAVWDWIRRTK